MLNLFYKKYQKITKMSKNTMMKINPRTFIYSVFNIKKPHSIICDFKTIYMYCLGFVFDSRNQLYAKVLAKAK